MWNLHRIPSSTFVTHLRFELILKSDDGYCVLSIILKIHLSCSAIVSKRPVPFSFRKVNVGPVTFATVSSTLVACLVSIHTGGSCNWWYENGPSSFWL